MSERETVRARGSEGDSESESELATNTNWRKERNSVTKIKKSTMRD